jgi:molybdopterin synthase catalytic subunit
VGHVHTGLSTHALDVQALVDDVTDPECGGIGVFIGTVRDSAAATENSGRRVVRLEYEAHESLAGTKLEEIAFEASEKWGLRRVVAMHRTGSCELGEPTVVVACSSPHRAEALEACRFIIDTIKATVPIFKKEIYADGSSWVGADIHA